MKKVYRLAYNWLEKWQAALKQANETQSDMLRLWVMVSRDLATVPEGLTEAEKKLYRSLIKSNFIYLEDIYIKMMRAKEGKPA